MSQFPSPFTSHFRFYSAVALTFAMALSSPACFADDEKESSTCLNTPMALTNQFGADFDKEPFKSGKLLESDMKTFETAFGIPSDGRVTIIHILRWSDAGHTQVQFQKWYVYAPNQPTAAYYFESAQKRFEDVYIPGEQHFRFVYIHLNSDLTDSGEFGTTDVAGTAVLKHQIKYGIVVTKQPTQFA